MPPASLDMVLDHLRKMIDEQQTRALSDQQLLIRFANQHDESAFAILVERHGPMVLSLCRRLLSKSHDVEDAFQATFLVLARKAASIRKQQALGSWLYGVAYRTAAKAFTRGRRERPLDPDVPLACDNNPLENMTWQELRQVLDDEIARLPERDRAALVLCHLESRTQDAAARELGCPKSTLATRLLRARELLRQRLSRRGISLSAAALATAMQAQAAPAAVPALSLIAVVQAAPAFAAGTVAASPATTLAEGVIHTMSSLQFKRILVLVLLLLGLGGGVAAGIHASRGPERDDNHRTTSVQAQLPEPEQAGKQKPEQPAIKLPADPNKVVILLDFQGGYTPPRKTNEPFLRIRADGTVIVIDPIKSDQPKHFKISADELQELLRFVIVEQKFFENGPEVVKAVTAAQMKRKFEFGVEDAPTTVLRITTADKDWESRVNALPAFAREFPEVKELQQLYQVERRLSRVRLEFYAGGKEEVAAALKLANAHLKENHPEVTPLSLDDFLGFNTRPNGGLFMFVRVGMIGKQRTVSVYVEQVQGKEPKVAANIQ